MSIRNGFVILFQPLTPNVLFCFVCGRITIYLGFGFIYFNNVTNENCFHAIQNMSVYKQMIGNVIRVCLYSTSLKLIIFDNIVSYLKGKAIITRYLCFRRNVSQWVWSVCLITSPAIKPHPKNQRRASILSLSRKET